MSMAQPTRPAGGRRGAADRSASSARNRAPCAPAAHKVPTGRKDQDPCKNGPCGRCTGCSSCNSWCCSVTTAMSSFTLVQTPSVAIHVQESEKKHDGFPTSAPAPPFSDKSEFLPDHSDRVLEDTYEFIDESKTKSFPPKMSTTRVDETRKRKTRDPDHAEDVSSKTTAATPQSYMEHQGRGRQKATRETGKYGDEADDPALVRRRKKQAASSPDHELDQPEPRDDGSAGNGRARGGSKPRRASKGSEGASPSPASPRGPPESMIQRQFWEGLQKKKRQRQEVQQVEEVQGDNTKKKPTAGEQPPNAGAADPDDLEAAQNAILALERALSSDSLDEGAQDFLERTDDGNEDEASNKFPSYLQWMRKRMLEGITPSSNGSPTTNHATPENTAPNWWQLQEQGFKRNLYLNLRFWQMVTNASRPSSFPAKADNLYDVWRKDEGFSAWLKKQQTAAWADSPEWQKAEATLWGSTTTSSAEGQAGQKPLTETPLFLMGLGEQFMQALGVTLQDTLILHDWAYILSKHAAAMGFFSQDETRTNKNQLRHIFDAAADLMSDPSLIQKQNADSTQQQDELAKPKEVQAMETLLQQLVKELGKRKSKVENEKQTEQEAEATHVNQGQGEHGIKQEEQGQQMDNMNSMKKKIKKLVEALAPKADTDAGTQHEFPEEILQAVKGLRDAATSFTSTTNVNDNAEDGKANVGPLEKLITDLSVPIKSEKLNAGTWITLLQEVEVLAGKDPPPCELGVLYKVTNVVDHVASVDGFGDNSAQKNYGGAGVGTQGQQTEIPPLNKKLVTLEQVRLPDHSEGGVESGGTKSFTVLLHESETSTQYMTFDERAPVWVERGGAGNGVEQIKKIKISSASSPRTQADAVKIGAEVVKDASSTSLQLSGLSDLLLDEFADVFTRASYDIELEKSVPGEKTAPPPSPKTAGAKVTHEDSESGGPGGTPALYEERKQKTASHLKFFVGMLQQFATKGLSSYTGDGTSQRGTTGSGPLRVYPIQKNYIIHPDLAENQLHSGISSQEERSPSEPVLRHQAGKGLQARRVDAEVFFSTITGHGQPELQRPAPLRVFVWHFLRLLDAVLHVHHPVKIQIKDDSAAGEEGGTSRGIGLAEISNSLPSTDPGQQRVPDLSPVIAPLRHSGTLKAVLAVKNAVINQFRSVAQALPKDGEPQDEDVEPLEKGLEEVARVQDIFQKQLQEQISQRGTCSAHQSRTVALSTASSWLQRASSPQNGTSLYFSKEEQRGRGPQSLADYVTNNATSDVLALPPQQRTQEMSMSFTQIQEKRSFSYSSSPQEYRAHASLLPPGPRPRSNWEHLEDVRAWAGARLADAKAGIQPMLEKETRTEHKPSQPSGSQSPQSYSDMMAQERISLQDLIREQRSFLATHLEKLESQMQSLVNDISISRGKGNSGTGPTIIGKNSIEEKQALLGKLVERVEYVYNHMQSLPRREYVLAIHQDAGQVPSCAILGGTFELVHLPPANKNHASTLPMCVLGADAATPSQGTPHKQARLITIAGRGITQKMEVGVGCCHRTARFCTNYSLPCCCCCTCCKTCCGGDETTKARYRKASENSNKSTDEQDAWLLERIGDDDPGLSKSSCSCRAMCGECCAEMTACNRWFQTEAAEHSKKACCGPQCMLREYLCAEDTCWCCPCEALAWCCCNGGQGSGELPESTPRRKACDATLRAIFGIGASVWIGVNVPTLGILLGAFVLLGVLFPGLCVLRNFHCSLWNYFTGGAVREAATSEEATLVEL
ncbi:unnamed protein product [Amoebophrya sp. A120]|nr:unnamed protein product [Amoebophrya sp. A120]|eukprot:GSA120T00024918001.1